MELSGTDHGLSRLSKHETQFPESSSDNRGAVPVSSEGSLKESFGQN